MKFHERVLQGITRRHFFRRGAFGIGSIALAKLCNENASAHSPKADGSLAAQAPHFAPRIKNVIFLFMCGGPSQVDLLDPKPMLKTMHGEPVPAELVDGERFAFITGR